MRVFKKVPHWCTRLLIFLELMAKQALYAKVQKKLFSSQKTLLVWKEFFKRHDYRAAHKSIQSVFTGSQNLSLKKNEFISWPFSERSSQSFLQPLFKFTWISFFFFFFKPSQVFTNRAFRSNTSQQQQRKKSFVESSGSAKMKSYFLLILCCWWWESQTWCRDSWSTGLTGDRQLEHL